MNVSTKWVNIDVDGKPMDAYVASPEGSGTYPGVIVFMEIFGINDHIQDVTRRIAREGYVAIAPDIYHRVAPGVKLGYTKPDIDTGVSYKAQVSQQNVLMDAKATIKFLQEDPHVSPKHRMGCIGFCFGGYNAYLVATLPDIAATASFYGAGIARPIPGKEEPPVDKTKDIKGFILCLYGENDASIPQDDIQAIEHALEESHIQHQVKVYAGADHGFFCDQRGQYNPEVAYDAWQEVRALFAKELKGVPVA